MSVRFDAAADRLLWTASLVDREANYSWCAFIRAAALPGSGGYATLFAIDDGSQSDWYGLQNNGTNTRLLVATSDTYSETFGTLNLAAATWYFVAGVRSAANARAGYIVPIGAALIAADVSHAGSPTGMTETRMELGAWTTGNSDPYDGRIAGLKIWNAALTLAELRRESLSLRAYRRANLVRWLPCFGGATERLRDYAEVLDATAGGTLTDEAGPSVPWGFYAPVLPVSIAAGALAYEQEGYRWRADDGSESGATWLAAQDNNISRAKLTNTRLRVLADTAAADPPSRRLKVQYRRQGDDGWRDLKA